MDHWPLRLLILLPVGILLLQYFIYALPSPVFLKVLVTLLAKHTTGMVLIMVSLRFISQQVDKKDLVLAMALVQGVRYLWYHSLATASSFLCGSRRIFND